MNVIDAIKLRKSVRAYQDRHVEDEKIDLIMKAAQSAPSAGNRQEGRYIIVKDKETREKLSVAAKGQKFVAQAPVVLAACAVTDEHVMTCGQMCYPIDVAIALDHISLAAVELELGTCWVGAFHEIEVKKLLGIPDEVKVVELMTLGYPEDPAMVSKNRLSLDEIVKYEKW